MNDQLYSAEEAAQILGLQVRTVRNYVREGRLPGVRIGKQYRISRSALEAFAGAGAGDPQRAGAASPAGVAAASGPALDVDVSSVVVIDGLSDHAAARITRTLAAMTSEGRGGEGQPRVEPLYDEQRLRLKVLVTGPATGTAEVLRVIAALADEGAGPLSPK